MDIFEGSLTQVFIKPVAETNTPVRKAVKWINKLKLLGTTHTYSSKSLLNAHAYGQTIGANIVDANTYTPILKYMSKASSNSGTTLLLSWGLQGTSVD